MGAEKIEISDLVFRLFRGNSRREDGMGEQVGPAKIVVSDEVPDA